MAEDKPEKDIAIVYVTSPNKRTLGVTGAYGGPAPDGRHVAVHLFAEYGTVPSLETLHVSGEGALLGNPDRTMRGDVTREVLATLIMTPEHAVALGEFMVERGSMALEFRKKGGEQ
jgi:hypothetical protein